MAIEVLLPKLGLTMQEGTIEEWLVAPGTAVRSGDAILRLATDKVEVDVEAEADGHLQPVAEVGAVLAPGTLIGWLLEAGEQPPAGVAAVAASVPAETVVLGSSAPAASHTANGRLLASPNARRLARDLAVELTALIGSGPNGRIVSEDVETAAVQVDATAATTVGLSPLVRKQARETGVDLAEVRGTGPGGRIRRGDLAREAPAVQPATDASTDAATVRIIPLTGMRGTIASRMHASLTEMAQLTHGFEVDMSAVVAVRKQLKAERDEAGPPTPSLNDFVVLAAARALEEHPGLNATVLRDGIYLLRDIHVGVAVAVTDGLLVPVISHAAQRSLHDLAAQSRALAEGARAGSLPLDRLQGATFVVTSLGGYGVDFFTPVINPGNVAILGVGRLRDGVRWDGEVPRRTSVLTLSLTFDHRAVDGAPAASYLQTVATLLSRPLHLLAC